MKNYCWKTILSLLMIVSLFLTMFPLSGLAAPTTGDVNQSSGYVSEIASGSLAGTSFDYMRSQNTPRIEDVGPIDGSVVYVGFACDDSEPVPEATDESDVALVERGDCLFVEKMDNIEGKGYSAVILFNDQRTDNDGCDAFPSSMSTSASIPMLAVYRTTGLQLLGEAGADPVTCPDGPATEASVGTVGERVFISAEFDPESTETGFEQRDGNGWTTLDEEQAFLEMLSEHSERVTYTQEGTSVEGRPIHLVRVGYPEPPSDEEIAAGRNILIMGTPHGNEPAGREMTLKLMRDLAFTEDPELLDQLSEATILFVPTTNPDGREANTRGNAWGIDNNRDHLNLNTPEMETVAKILHEFRPDITVDAHERPSASGNPDIEVLWPRNLNVDEDLRALNVELVQEYMRPDIEDHGFTTGLYGSPGGAGGGDERILRNMAGLRHGLGILTETAGRQDPNYRVEAQMHAAESVLRYYRERFDEIEQAIVESKQKKTAEGADPSQPFYIDGADNWDPTNVLNPKPCGYVIHTSQAESISKHIELFGLETEQVSENGVFVTMNQPMMTVIPFLLDERASYNEVAGLALSDCSDPGAVEPPTPPEQTEPAQYNTDFAEYEVGELPAGWSPLWRDSLWTVQDDPRRLEHIVIGAGNGRRALTWDEVGNVQGDVEVSGVVRASGTGDTMLQIGFHMSGSEENENAYYLDARSPDASSSANRVRINRYVNGSYTLLSSTELPFTLEEDTWYHVVLKREGDRLWAKMWPYGEDEPAHFQVMTVDSTFDSGRVGVSHFTSGTTNDWAFFGVGTGGEEAPRAPEDLFEPTDPEVDKTVLRNRVDEIHTEDLNEADYTEASWHVLQQALAAAENVLNDPEATQAEVDAALAALNEARDGLRKIGEDPVSAATMIQRVEDFADEGAFDNNSAVRSLTMHLTAVGRYEAQEQAAKVVKHMESFKQLLDYERENAWISDEAYHALYADAESLIEEWQ